MKILSINTANKQSDLALNNNGQVLVKKMSASEKHSESVMLGIDNLLTEAGLKIKDLDAVATITGPGSFTGIRIGISLGLGFKTAFDNLKLIEISAFEFLKEQFLKDNQKFNQNFVCVFNALSDKYFVQEFDLKGKPLSQAKMVDGLGFVTDEKTFVGLEEEGLDFLTHKIVLSPEVLNEIAVQKFENKVFSETLTPVYLRKSQAEDMLDRKE